MRVASRLVRLACIVISERDCWPAVTTSGALLACAVKIAPIALAPAGAANPRLRPFTSCDGLVAYARARAAKQPETVPMPLPSGRPVEATPTATATEAPAEPDFSATNVQEQGIDEPDTVKTDGMT